MRIHHVSIGTTNLERMVGFYKKYFGAVEHSTYERQSTGLKICFLEFDKGAQLEIVTRPGFVYRTPDHGTGYAHLALHAGDRDGVDFITKRLENDGYTVVSQPHTNRAGIYESTVLDPDGNWIELTAGRLRQT